MLLSILLGSHPPRLPVRTLVRMGEVFGISEGTVRVALSRMASDGEVDSGGGSYQLSEPLRARQRALDQGRRPRLRAWRGTWEMAVVPDGVDSPTRTELGRRLRSLGLAPLRDGVWLRPANLLRPDPAAAEPDCRWLTAQPAGDPAELATELWDLTGWSARGGALLAALEAEDDPAGRFTVTAALLRHLRDDPLLPTRLLPADWPGPALRRANRAYERELRRLLAEQD